MESLRLYPPVPMTIRQAGKNDYVDGTYVPKGTLFYVAVGYFILSCLAAFLYLTNRFGS